MNASTQPPAVRISGYGESALLVELDDLESVHRAYATLRQAGIPGVVDLVPAARSVLVLFDGGRVDLRQVGRVLDNASGPGSTADAGPLVSIPVVYDGEDLEEVAALAGLTVEEVVSRHSAPEYLAAFSGFVPGFSYLTGLDPRLRLPRLPSPRVRVPAGSVAIADEITAVCPRRSPCGWRLLGHTDADLFDVRRDPPALLAPTTRVRFRPEPA